jgi:hypothetical protein
VARFREWESDHPHQPSSHSEDLSPYCTPHWPSNTHCRPDRQRLAIPLTVYATRQKCRCQDDRCRKGDVVHVPSYANRNSFASKCNSPVLCEPAKVTNIDSKSRGTPLRRDLDLRIPQFDDNLNRTRRQHPKLLCVVLLFSTTRKKERARDDNPSHHYQYHYNFNAARGRLMRRVPQPSLQHPHTSGNNDSCLTLSHYNLANSDPPCYSFPP